MTTALYPGTFDPVTNGHADIIQRACAIVDELIIGVAINHDKKPLFSLEERIDMVEKEAAKLTVKTRIRVAPFEGLLVHFAKEAGARIIIRGLRAVTDFDYEFQMTGMNCQLAPDIETVFLIASATHQSVSSRLVKEISRMGGDISSFVSPEIKNQLANKHVS